MKESAGYSRPGKHQESAPVAKTVEEMPSFPIRTESIAYAIHLYL